VFNELMSSFFHKPLSEGQLKWFASDGKELRGSISKGDTRGEAITQLLEHSTKLVTSQNFYNGQKESERPCVLKLLKNNCVNKKITLDALHLTPETTTFIEGEGGVFLIGIKDNQKELLDTIISVSNLKKPITNYKPDSEKGNGRIDTRAYQSFDLSHLTFEKRWSGSNFKTAVKVERERYNCKTKEKSMETAYYIANQKVPLGDVTHELFHAVKNHWRIETNNRIRDVSLKEDDLKSKFSELSRNMATCRTIALNAIYQLKPTNIKEMIDDFTDNIQTLFKTFRQFKFL
jgi:predicted transposase YbfD/YdcC